MATRVAEVETRSGWHGSAARVLVVLLGANAIGFGIPLARRWGAVPAQAVPAD